MRCALKSTALVMMLSSCGQQSDSQQAPASSGDAPARQAGSPFAATIVAQCRTCHTMQAGGASGIGPNLWGIVGRKAGTAPAYSYSAAMKQSGIIWTRDEIGAYLLDPQKHVPGTKMSLAGIVDQAKRKKILDYLESMK